MEFSFLVCLPLVVRQKTFVVKTAMCVSSKRENIRHKISQNVAYCNYLIILLFSVSPVARWFLARLIFDTEDGGDTFLRNVISHTDYTALYPRCDGNIHNYRC
jgi:hypothetical protein